MIAMRRSRKGIIPQLSICLLLGACSTVEVQEENTDKLVAEMSQRVVATTEAERRDGVLSRYNQPKTVACLSGNFRVAADVPEPLQHGLFASVAEYPVVARFANASQWDDSKKDIRGVSLRVSQVPGATLWGEAGMQDFLFNSYPALFVATPEEFLAFMRARQEGDRWSMLKFFLSPRDPHVKSLFTVIKARKRHDSPLDIRYWSTVPSALDERIGADGQLPPDVQAVKYSLTPCSDYQTDKTIDPGENQLRAALDAHLQQAPACLAFGVQRQVDPQRMPIEDASVIWDEDDSPFVTVATLHFDQQEFASQESLAQCEQRQFNPWQSLPAHAPLGRMNAVRKKVYATGAYHREMRGDSSKAP
ncbi:hypothetical protein ACUNV4_12350 [Granulosicoccus sp. 3-233]|uniref:hypothetical protein n=1 Tax=Granulosicoccus sp. 3-233 TaxID=3417969 RepID=UPI003D347098